MVCDLGVAADQFGNRLRQVCRSRGRVARCHERSRSDPNADARRSEAWRFEAWRFDAWRFDAWRSGVDLAGKLIAATGNVTDQVAVCPECMAQGRDLGLQVILADHPPRPDPGREIVLADDGSRRVDQCQEQVERARAKPYRRIAGEQLSTVRQQPEPAERDAGRRVGGGDPSAAIIGRMQPCRERGDDGRLHDPPRRG